MKQQNKSISPPIKNEDQPVNFGKFRDLTYKQLFDNQGGYCRWFLSINEEPTDFLKLKPKPNKNSTDLLEYINKRLLQDGHFKESKDPFKKTKTTATTTP